jgi:DNA invertase Pin-like site-specific DNA recombinase
VPTDVLGYASDRDLDTSARIIGSWCEARGWPLARVVHDAAGQPMADRPGLGYVLDQIADGRVAGVVVARLTDITSSLSEMAELLEWIESSQAFLIAIDYEIAASGVEDRPVVTPGRWDR